MMKSTLINAMKGFVVGGGTGVAVALTGLALWTGTTDLQTIRTSVQNYMVEVEEHSSALAQDYQVTVNSANAEIGEYKVALQQANDNISQLITAYESKVTELGNANTKYETDMKELQEEYDKMVQKINLDYKLDMNEVVEKANEQIEKANEEVGQTKENVLNDLKTSQVDEIVANAKQLKDQLNTGNDKTVTSIEDIVPTEQQGE